MTDQFVEFCLRAGIPGDPVLDKKEHRFIGPDDTKEDSWYKGGIEIINGRSIRSITVKNWKWADGEFLYYRDGMSDDEIKEYSVKAKESKNENEAEKERKQKEAQEKAQRIWADARPSDGHEYLKRKGLTKTYGTKCSDSGELLIPVRDSTGRIWGLQKILPGGEKRFLSGMRKKGLCYVIPPSEEKKKEKLAYVCEGFATACSVWEATGGSCVFVAFDAGNLLPLCLEIRKMTDAEIIVAGDNDCWGERNVGAEKAEEAASAVNGKFVCPSFGSHLREQKPTDWNDLSSLYGYSEVEQQLKNNLMTPEKQETTEHREEIIPLGFRGPEYFYVSEYSKKIISMTATGHTPLKLLELQPLSYWDSKYSQIVEKKTKTGVSVVKLPINWTEAADDLIGTALEVGYFNSKRVRGSGCYLEGGKVVLNIGSELIVGKKRVAFKDHKSKYVYTVNETIEWDDNLRPLSVEEGKIIQDAIEYLRWKKPAHAKILLGWLVVAPFCGALDWRPHLWIIGTKGRGKSWLLKNLIAPLLGPFGESFLANTTEAGIRQACENNAKAILWDEPEMQNQEDAKAIQRVLNLARQASAESYGRVAKGSASGKAVEYNIKSCFLLSSIRSALTQSQDESRFSVIAIDHEPDKNVRFTHFQKLKGLVEAAVSDRLPERLFRRTFERFVVLQKNIDFFQEGIGKHFTARIAQQYGSLLGGYWTLISDSSATEEDVLRLASECIPKHQSEEDVEEDKLECLKYLLGKMVTVDSMSDAASGTVRMSIGEIVEKEDPKGRLQSFGIKYIDDKHCLFVCKSHPELETIFRNSKFQSWHNVLLQVPDAKYTSLRVGGVVHYGTLLPLTRIINQGCKTFQSLT